MKNLTIRAKITLGFVVIIALMVISTVAVVVSNVITRQKLHAINADSTLQTKGTDLADTFYNAKLNTRVIIIQPDDTAYAEAVRSLEVCGNIIEGIKTHINENPVLEKFRASFDTVASQIRTYSGEIDNLQESNKVLSGIGANIESSGERLTELSDALDMNNITTVYEGIESDITAVERTRQMNDLAAGAGISHNIWTLRVNASVMYQMGNGYSNYDADLQLADNAIATVENVRSISGEGELAELKIQLTKYRQYITEFRDEMNHNNATITAVVTSGDDVMNILNSMMTDIDSEMENQMNNSISTSTVALTAVISIAVISIVAAVIMAAYIINTIVSVLRKSVQNMKNVSDTVVVSSQQLNEGSAQLAEGASEQAASIEETSATMNQTASMVHKTKENTYQAVELSEESEHNASESVQKVENLMEIMNNLNNSSKEISNILGTINAIAMQTSILALNASVEAVRAGEAGKSFSVVAEEVRGLSMKSTMAASSTAKIIERNIALTLEGTNSAKEVSNALNGIFASVQKVNTLLGEISSASDEQSRGVDQINIALTQMEKATQSSAAVAQESSAAANEMLNSSGLLASVTSELSAMI